MFNIRAQQEDAAQPNRPKRRVFTAEEIADMTRDMQIVDPDQWEEIPVGSIVRYTRRDGHFVKGGILRVHSTMHDEPVFRLESEVSNKKWPVKLSDISTVWSNWVVMPSKHEEYKTVINSLIDQVKKLNARISYLEKMIAGGSRVQSPRMPNVEQRLLKLEGTIGGLAKKLGYVSPRLPAA